MDDEASEGGLVGHRNKMGAAGAEVKGWRYYLRFRLTDFFHALSSNERR